MSNSQLGPVILENWIVVDSTSFQVYYMFNSGGQTSPVWVFPQETVGDVVKRIIQVSQADANYDWTANLRGTSLNKNSTVASTLKDGDSILMSVFLSSGLTSLYAVLTP